MRSGICICAVIVVISVALSGCLGMKTLPVSPPAAPALLVDYQRTGGFAGVNDRLVIFDNGATVISSRAGSKEILLNQTDLDRISSIFNEGQFSMLDENYTSHAEGADFMQYSISYHGKTVRTEDTAIPPSLEPIIEEMNVIIRRGFSSSQMEYLFPNIAS
jgi:hypothetical protein